MLDALSAAISGLKVASTRTRITSNNLANINTDNFKRSVAVQESGKEGGATVRAVVDRSSGFPLPAQPAADLPARETSNVDIATEMVELIKARHAFSASIKTIQTEDGILGNLIDIKS